MPNGRITACPYYITHKQGRGGWDYTVTCENIRENMGFAMRTQLRFESRQEMHDYMGLFCCDGGNYASCPYYQAVYNKEARTGKDAAGGSGPKE